MANILVDRHHAGLLYSLQRLFEDRLGMDLYVPIGHDWWDEGYWQFGAVFGDDRLAQQYLMPNPPWTHTGAWTTEDVEFPDRFIWGAELTEARDMKWDFVMATVQENQGGFHKFAKEVGATYLYQVGNNGQQIAWDLNPLVLSSAKIHIQGKGVTYHQEFDKDGIFSFVDSPVPTNIIRTFVNCFDRINPQYEKFLEFEQELGGFECFVHGHDGRNGLVQPTDRIAGFMASADWGYHDKPQGDGFGHVIHYWAAIGRPLIGTASNYAGLFAEHLWDDKVTSVNLDKRSPQETAKLVRELTESGKATEMGRAIRQRLDELVDFDREEQEIRALLGL